MQIEVAVADAAATTIVVAEEVAQAAGAEVVASLAAPEQPRALSPCDPTTSALIWERPNACTSMR